MNRLYSSQTLARAAQCGILDMCLCANCGFAWNRAFDPSLVAYDGSYENDQSLSAAFLAHVKARAIDVVASVQGNEPIDYLEIGCGQGGFISEVVHAAGSRLRTAQGFDPAWRGEDGSGPEGSHIHKAYFTSQSRKHLKYAPNIVVMRHITEHVLDPVALLGHIRAALGTASEARLFIETPSIEWILANGAMQDLYYEHCSKFSSSSLRHALELASFTSVTTEFVFGAQYIWASAIAANAAKLSAFLADGNPKLSTDGMQFAAKWAALVNSAHNNGSVALWGAGAKGVNFALLSAPVLQAIDYVIDINPEKQGLFMPVSGLEVLSLQAAAQRQPKTIFVMNPNYFTEISEMARHAGLQSTLIAIH